MAAGGCLVLEALVEFSAVSLAGTDLDHRSLTLVRIAAPVAAPSSYLLHVGPSFNAGVTAPTTWSGVRRRLRRLV